MPRPKQLHKFGGSLLATPECYRHAVQILAQYSKPGDLVVVSAAGKTTNQLITFLHGLTKDGRLAHEALMTLRQFQLELLESLLDGERLTRLRGLLTDEFSTLASLTAPLSDAEKAAVMGHGELWSARLLAELLSQRDMAAVAQDARQFLRAQAGTLPQVNQALSYPLLHSVLQHHQNKRLVITGFMAQGDNGETVLLGRNGSDYSATVIGALAGVERVTIWGDVAGVYSADPHWVEEACLLPLLRLDEASELARLAAPVLHNRTLQPVAQSAIELRLRSVAQPESGSTRIERILASGRGAKIVTSLDEVQLIQLTFGSEQNYARQEHEVLTLLERAQLSPLAFDPHPDQSRLRLAYTSELAAGVFRYLQELGLTAELRLQQGYSLVAAVGSGVTDNAHHCHAFYQQLKSSPVEFIAPSGSGLSVVAILRQTPLPALMERLHTQLFRAQKRIAIALCGKGNIGSAWLTLFDEQKAELEKRHGLAFELVMVVDSEKRWFDPSGIDPKVVASQFERQSQNKEGYRWLDTLASLDEFDETVVLDLTASKTLTDHYVTIADLGMHLISANKIAGSASSQQYERVQSAFAKVGGEWLYNATVGAGLPINHTLRDLRQSGDEVVAISGIFSGTLSWLFQQFDGQVPFHELIDLAWQQGLTEPDPRNDLDGSDVMRKLVILAREAGLKLEPHQVKIESLVPEALSALSLDDFFDNASQLSQALQERLEHAKKRGLVLRYVARLDKSGSATVGIEALSPHHALANLLPCDNIFAVESRWYKENPLVIRGPGAGRVVTAGAILSDLNRIGARLSRS
ncbi:bifunctional aspartate kinase/homoserine dehydrogenase II [Vibrio sp. SM6]|uniref:Bifunctional aspartokinase/homoserine dehydrogenase n=1 Tax=Vibrio agarilyticus TaxID=2726741 RepID=A0A7X8YHH2_9VIBR|nr:bifunctional aspartate kinase/homoserine dehydrogenase II [Vibrio agarilyticus]NLS13496.1 bifunctional aspartate kinase/homoserine dehydrogenase II [Vibrio agarilyticus]